MQEILLKKSFANLEYFKPTDNFQNFLESLGYESWYEIKARTNKKIIDYVKKNGTYDETFKIYSLTGEGYKNSICVHGYIQICEVDTSKPWTIDTSNGLERIQYLDYEIINKKLKYCKLKEEEIN